MAGSRVKPTDATGVARQKAIKENAEAIRARQDEIATVAAVEAQRLESEVFDPKVDTEVVVVDEVEEVGVVLADDAVVVRVVADIENMTYGYGNNYSFRAGVKYKVPREVADHLTDLGYVY